MNDDYFAQNGHTAIRVTCATEGAYIGITNDVRVFPGGERAQITVSADQAREIARSLVALADAVEPPDDDDQPLGNKPEPGLPTWAVVAIPLVIFAMFLVGMVTP